ncbi:MAG TPA: transglycosylase domain-containing protein, partial [Polyangiaceae bacterium]|nr:transglycosylase domain-containing protein [Polyangiaceae bacterium]
MMFLRTLRLPRRARLGAWLALALLVSSFLGWQLLGSLAGSPLAALADPWHREREVVDRRGQPLRRIPSSNGLRGSPLELEAMGDRLITATLVSEDRRFYEHAGVDPTAVLRAIKQNVQNARLVSGASTVTQQLVKLLDSEGKPTKRGLWLKLVETARATNLEERLSKREILTAYINRLNYGRGLVGPERAAHTLFGKSPAQLSWAEASLLAVLPRAPSSLDPYRHPDRVQRRQQALLRALALHGFLGSSELERALESSVELLPVSHPFEAPHFVDSLLEDPKLAGEHQLRTTLDLTLQREVDGVLQSHRERLLARGADNASVIVVDNASGEILAYVGSLAYHATPSGQVDHASAPRQAGSTLKPFVYALAFA